MSDKELRKKKKQLLASIKSDIKKLDTYINTCENDGFKKKSIVKTKVFFIKLRAISPYIGVLACSSCFSFFILDDVPFFINDIKRREHIKIESDSYGNLSFEQQYNKFPNEQNVVSSYSSWVKEDDGMYKRDIVVYYSDKFTLEELERIVMNSDVSNLNVINTIVERKNNISSQELSMDPYYKYTFYELSDDYYVVPETQSHNNYFTFIWFLITTASFLGVSYYRENISDFSYYNSVQEVYRRFLPNGDDINIMKKILDNKIGNYKLMVKKNEKK